MNLIAPLWQLVVANSGRATFLIVCVFLLRWLCRGRLPARFFPWLWLLVAVRLLLPVVPSSSLSVHNLFVSQAELPVPSSGWVVRKGLATPPEPVPTIKESAPSNSLPPAPARSGPFPVLPMIWLAGICLQAALLGWSACRMRVALREATAVNDPRLLTIARECADALGLRRGVALFETSQVAGPSIVGLWRPRLLLPRGLSTHLSDEEIRFVLLHECAHLRRHDLPAVWLLLAVRIVHWFNPLVWLAVRAARVDAEIACDEAVLRHSEAGAPQCYGAALLRLAQLVPWQPALHPALGIVQRRTALGVRLANVSRYSPSAGWRTAASVTLVFMVAVVFGAEERRPSATESGPGNGAAVEHRSRALPSWAEGISVRLVTIPKEGEASPAEVEMQTAEGKAFIPPSAEPLDHASWVESLTRADDGSRWTLVLRRGDERAEFTVPKELVVRRDEKNRLAVFVEVESHLIETTDTAILRQTSKTVAAERLRTMVRRGPEEQTLSAAEASELVGAFNAMKGASTLAAPRVTTRIGQRAVIEIIREFRYPTKWKRDRSEGPWLPIAFETRNTGMTVEVEPIIDQDGKIRPHLTVQAVEILGSRDAVTRKGFPLGPGTPRTFGQLMIPGQLTVTHPGMTEAGVPPVFSTRKRETNTPLASGDSLLLASLPETEDVEPFTSPAKTHRLIALVTARLVNPEREGAATVAATKSPPSAPLSEAEISKAPLDSSPPSPAPAAILRPGDKPGFVLSPFAPESAAVDVRGMPSGTAVKCPYSGKVFLVP